MTVNLLQPAQTRGGELARLAVLGGGLGFLAINFAVAAMLVWFGPILDTQ